MVLRVVAVAVITGASLAVVTACTERAPPASRAAAATAKPDFVDVDWPAVQDSPAMHLRIPRSDLAESFLHRETNGRIVSVGITIRLPPASRPPPEVQDAFDAGVYGRRTTRAEQTTLMVELLGSPPDPDRRAQSLAQQRTCQSCSFDGIVGGLIRTSPGYCAPAPYNGAALRELADKPADDPFPTGCVAVRGGSYFNTPAGTDEPMDVWCSFSICNVKTQFAGRSMEIQMSDRRIDHALAWSDLAREQLSSYVVR